jgi:hypothetical protein
LFAQVNLHSAINDGDQEDYTGSTISNATPQPEYHQALVFGHNTNGIGKEGDHNDHQDANQAHNYINTTFHNKTPLYLEKLRSRFAFHQ